jgi:hypothetical protein
MSLWWVLVGIAHFKNAHVCFDLRLYGTTVSQTIFYFRSFPNDSKATKYLVSE